MSKHVREKCGILCISSILRSKRGVTPTKIDVTQTWYVVRQNKVICKISAQYVTACKRKKRKTVYFQYSKFQKGHDSHKNWRNYYSKTKSYAKFQLNMSKHVRENCGKLIISSFLSLKRGITPTKIDGNWWLSNLICSTVRQSRMQNLSAICQSM